MRRLHRLLASGALAATVLAGGCSDDETGNNNDNSLSATIDGTAFTATTVQGTYSSNLLAFSGLNGTTSVTFAVPNVTATGTFQLGVGQAGIAQVNVGTQNWTTALTGGTGSLTVTALSSSEATGTFTFSAPATTSTGATGTKAVTSGSFTIHF